MGVYFYKLTVIIKGKSFLVFTIYKLKLLLQLFSESLTIYKIDSCSIPVKSPLFTTIKPNYVKRSTEKNKIEMCV